MCKVTHTKLQFLTFYHMKQKIIVTKKEGCPLHCKLLVNNVQLKILCILPLNYCFFFHPDTWYMFNLKSRASSHNSLYIIVYCKGRLHEILSWTLLTKSLKWSKIIQSISFLYLYKCVQSINFKSSGKPI